MVIKVRSSAEAARAFHACGGRIDLLLTDVVLPGRSGQQLAQELRTLRPRLKTVFISGYPDPGSTSGQRQFPGSAYLAKPFSMESLLQKVNAALD
jgi:DNA-binding NtrC family response regulator